MVSFETQSQVYGTIFQTSTYPCGHFDSGHAGLKRAHDVVTDSKWAAARSAAVASGPSGRKTKSEFFLCSENLVVHPCDAVVDVGLMSHRTAPR